MEEWVLQGWQAHEEKCVQSWHPKSSRSCIAARVHSKEATCAREAVEARVRCLSRYTPATRSSRTMQQYRPATVWQEGKLQRASRRSISVSAFVGSCRVGAPSCIALRSGFYVWSRGLVTPSRRKRVFSLMFSSFIGSTKQSLGDR